MRKAQSIVLYVTAAVMAASLTLSACASSPASSSNGARTAARQTPARQENPLNTGKARPAWVDSVDAVYDRRQYAAALGYAGDRALAEKNALANLAAIFGQSIQADQKITNTYEEAVKNGVTAGWTDNTEVQNVIQTSASMDALIGAEIAEVWFDGKSTWYAAAIMDRAKSVRLYTDLIRANQTMIERLLSMNQAEKNSLEGFSRFQFAAAAADMNIAYGNLLKVLGAAPPDGLKPGDEYRLLALNIVKAIPVGITVKGDRAGRIQGAFAKALAGLGFRSGAANSRYVLEADFGLSEAVFQNQQNKFARYEITANLVDTSGGKTVLFPYTANGREGHGTLTEAENRAVSAAERRINEEYKALLSDYLSQLLPKK